MVDQTSVHAIGCLGAHLSAIDFCGSGAMSLINVQSRNVANGASTETFLNETGSRCSLGPVGVELDALVPVDAFPTRGVCKLG